MSDGKLRWAIIGTGHIARKFASDLRFSKTGRLAAVGSRRAARATAFAEAMGGGVTGGETAAVLGRDDVDVVYVATPNGDHVNVALQVIAAGKPVLIEKPVAVSADEARTIREAAAAAELLAMEAMWILFTPGIVRLRSLLAEGRIGDPSNFNASLSYARPYREGDKLFDPRSGGALLDLGVYPIALAQNLFGAPDDTSGIAQRLGNGSVRQAALSLRFADRLATIACGFEAEGPNQAVVMGTRGFITTKGPLLCPPALAIRAKSPPGPYVPADDGQVEPLEKPSRLAALSNLRKLASAYRERLVMTPFVGTGLQYQADHFAECLRDGLTESPVHPMAASEAVLRTIEVVGRRG
ncbi:Gfo/Idh/MocA family oxidoreductase [Fulvimarina sp. 2208YS6-2-32]|uniref:Gfo/Idh/MocA family oxidoreductase n=1 Tax=Fulvimarina uroteuthidis TaxID=3098149 RepID=A0ABU5HY17_9HYPH|nr:Gfo/Idh/MocA family oxidoreductase [Fulvimarina sp. 2208YS6-2-32]MDY8108032.1 Gfo/Idh/MocA family oxidoreductase [Fulvimarina sp. 2208YS6-2-32]